MPLLEVNQLSKSFGDTSVIQSLNFSLAQGRNIALIGANGAGKTTTMRMITGLIKPSLGEIKFKGESVDLRKHIGYLPQHPVFHEWMTGEEYLNYIGKIMAMSPTLRQEKIEHLLKLTQIYEAKDKRIGKYSGGMKQRLGIAQALLHDPNLLILDEPVSALDPVGRREVLTLMAALKEKTTMLFSTHILRDAEEICDDVILMHKGQIIEAQSLLALKAKYQTTLIEIAFDLPHEAYKKTIEAMPFVTHVTEANHALHIAVTDLGEAKASLLAAIAEEKWPIKLFRINEASLEDLFMKAVSK